MGIVLVAEAMRPSRLDVAVTEARAALADLAIQRATGILSDLPGTDLGFDDQLGAVLSRMTSTLRSCMASRDELSCSVLSEALNLALQDVVELPYPAHLLY
jgi:hypothetical protein